MARFLKVTKLNLEIDVLRNEKYKQTIERAKEFFEEMCIEDEVLTSPVEQTAYINVDNVVGIYGLPDYTMADGTVVQCFSVQFSKEQSWTVKADFNPETLCND